VKAFYGSRISPNMTKTPEGFLICHNVPIARTGWQEYLGQEIGLNDLYDQKIQVYRSPEEVFHPATIASFEGKSVTDEHPPDSVRPDNYASYEKGQVTNVRQGTGEESDLLLADLIIKDPRHISEIENGKREVSCGYDCVYEPLGDGKYQQKQIRGNHVAVVASGRAGPRVAIKDESPKPKTTNERSEKMKPNRKTLIGKMLSAFARDAEPEELAEASRMVVVMDDDDRLKKDDDDKLKSAKDDITVQAAPKPPITTDEPSGVEELAKKIDELTAIVKQLVETDRAVHAQKDEPDSLEALEKELEARAEKGGEKSEESVTIPAEKMADDNVDPGPVAPPEDRPDNPIPGADSRNAVLAAIRAVKPVIASIKDPAERKKASDALAKTFRDQIAAAAKNPKADGYAAILEAVAANTKTQDKKPDNNYELGREWAKKYNPHYKNREVK
jgi:hypothetical protein